MSFLLGETKKYLPVSQLLQKACPLFIKTVLDMYVHVCILYICALVSVVYLKDKAVSKRNGDQGKP